MMINKTEDIELFPTLLMRVPNFLTNEKCEWILNTYRNSEILAPHKYFIGPNSRSSHAYDKHVDVLRDIDSSEMCSGVYSIVEGAIKEYTKKTGIANVAITNSWLNIQNEGGKIFRHAHPGSVITGIIYVNADEGSALYFYDNNIATCWTPNQSDTKYKQEKYRFVPTTGDLILFPSWLQHGTEEDFTTFERTALAFNTHAC